MAIDYQPGGDVGNSKRYIEHEGWYHFVIVEARETALKRDGSIIPGQMCQFECAVLDASIPDQRDKEWSVCIRQPNPGDKDGGDFGRKLADRWWLALSAMTLDEIVTKKRVSINVEGLRGRQFIAKLKKGERYIDLDGCEIYHVDDPAVKDQKKSIEDLKKIRPEYRRQGTAFKAAGETKPEAPKVDPDNL